MDLDNKVENIMSTPLISVDSSSSLEKAADVMLTNNITFVYIVMYFYFNNFNVR